MSILCPLFSYMLKHGKCDIKMTVKTIQLTFLHYFSEIIRNFLFLNLNYLRHFIEYNR